MPDELMGLLDTAIYREIVSQAFYSAGQKQTTDPGAKALMKELAGEEMRHSERLKELKDKGLEKQRWHREGIPDLMISQYLVGGDRLEDAGLQDVLVFAMKREQQAVESYSRMMSMVTDEMAKHLCEQLVHEELKHKLKLEILYDDILADLES